MKYVLMIIAVVLLCGCPEKKPQKAAWSLQKAKFAELTGWQNDNFLEVIPVFATNCKKINLIKQEQIYPSKIAIDTNDYKDICNSFFRAEIKTGQAFREFIENHFEPYLVLDNGKPQGKFTSYYEAEIHASLEQGKEYQYPVYGRPHDLIEVNLQDFDKTLPSRRIVGRIEKQKLIPYYTRAEIENYKTDAPVILWADSLVDIHIMQIQGSAIAIMDDGSRLRVGYADNNGHPFKGIGSILLEKGLLKSGEVSMINIKKWLEANPDAGIKNMQENNRFIFHQIIKADGPLGAYGLPLTAGRSMAVDSDIVPLGSFLWLDTYTPDKRPLQKLMAAQDVGSAIKGTVRGDYFWGSGGDDVLEMAGNMNSAGKYFILLPKAQN